MSPNERPICFFDLETTGTDLKKDRIVEIAVVKIFPLDGTMQEFHSLVNPEMPIPESATAVHGISDKKVRKKPILKSLVPKLKEIFDGSDIGGYNSNRFDIPFLYNEFLRVGYEWELEGKNFIDVLKIYQTNESRTLSDAVKFYLGKDHEGAHGALSDARATREVFSQQVMKYPHVFVMDRIALDLYCNNGSKRIDMDGFFGYDDKGVIIFKKGKNKGEPISTDISYLQWMLRSDFLPDTKKFIQSFLDNLKNKK